jgi:hypothetical protein
MELYGLGAMHFLMKGSLKSSQLTDLDFSYVEVPRNICSYRQEIILPGTVKSERPISAGFATQPSSALKYGFCSVVKPTLEEHFGTTYGGPNLQTVHWNSLACPRPSKSLRTMLSRPQR